MKKKIIAFLAGCVVLASSCNKAEKNAVTPQSKSTSGRNTSRMDMGASGWGLNNTYIDLLDWCVHIPFDCYDVVVITRSQTVQQFPRLDAAISSGGLSVTSFFNDPYLDPDFADLWENNDLINLKSGALHIAGVHNGGRNYYFVSTSSQVSSTNFDRVYQFDY